MKGLRRLARLCTLAFAVSSALLFAAPRAQADEPVAPDKHDPLVYPPESARYYGLIAGAATLAVWYGAAYGASSLFPDAPGAEQLHVPVAGPWMAFAETGCSKKDPHCSVWTTVLREVLTVIDGVGQGGGVLVMVESAFLTTQAPARGGALPRARAARTTWEPGPIVVSGDRVWLSVVGHF